MEFHTFYISRSPVPPVIKEGSSVVTAHVNQEAVLACEYLGDTPVTVMWRKDGFPIAKDNKKWVLFYTSIVVVL